MAMIKRTRLLLLLAVCSAGCATTPPPPPLASIEREHMLEMRRLLESTREQIDTRGTRPSAMNLAVVDIDAARSMPIPEHRTVASAVRLFSTSMKSSIQTYLRRSAEYKLLIEKALAEAGLPRGLVYLPVIESGYSPTLTSRAGARGIWQFMPETAREYGMRVDWWIDERCDVEKSTRAAAEYLRDLYRQFDDWPLALAAYNAGPGRVRGAMSRTGATTFWELLEQTAIPKETRGYVPTFYATLAIAGDPETHGFELLPPVPSDVKRVDVIGPVSLEFIAETAGTPLEQVRALNPSFRRDVVPPGRATLRVPADRAERIAASAESLRQHDPYLAFSTYTLRSGDSINRIARAIGSDVDTLLAMNGLAAAERARAGHSIYLPVRPRELGPLLAQGSSEIYYAVKKGDTLYSVAKRHNLTVEELRDINDLSRNAKLHPGQKLRVNTPRALTAGGM